MKASAKRYQGILAAIDELYARTARAAFPASASLAFVNVVLAFGVDAKRMLGKTPAHIQAVRPLRKSLIAALSVCGLTPALARIFEASQDFSIASASSRRSTVT